MAIPDLDWVILKNLPKMVFGEGHGAGAVLSKIYVKLQGKWRDASEDF